MHISRLRLWQRIYKCSELIYTPLPYASIHLYTCYVCISFFFCMRNWMKNEEVETAKWMMCVILQINVLHITIYFRILSEKKKKTMFRFTKETQQWTNCQFESDKKIWFENGFLPEYLNILRGKAKKKKHLNWCSKTFEQCRNINIHNREAK